MTRETVRIFVEHVYNNGFDTCINGHNGEEDSYLGRKYFKNVIMPLFSIVFAAMCLEVFDVIFGDTRDPSGAERFLQLSLHNLYRPFDYQSTLRAFFPSKSVSFLPIIFDGPAFFFFSLDETNFVFKTRDLIVARTKQFPSIQLRTSNF